MKQCESANARDRNDVLGWLLKVWTVRDTKRNLGIDPALLVLIATVGIIAAMFLYNVIGQLFAAI